MISDRSGSVSRLRKADSIDNAIRDLCEEIDVGDGLDHYADDEMLDHGVNDLSGRFADMYSA